MKVEDISKVRDILRNEPDLNTALNRVCEFISKKEPWINFTITDLLTLADLWKRYH